MKRKAALKRLLTSGGICISIPAIGFGKSIKASAFIQDFLHRWEIAKQYSLNVMEKMPVEGFDYAPTAEQMGFGNHFTHAGYWNTFYLGNIIGKEPINEPKEFTKAVVKKYFLECFNYGTKVIEGWNEEDLDRKGYGTKEYWKNHTGRDLLLRAYMHTTHHRAQAMIYLRLQGIEPPAFEF